MYNSADPFSEPRFVRDRVLPTIKTAPADISQIASSGGLVGLNPFLLIPIWDTAANDSYFNCLFSKDYNCEEDAHYNFRVENVKNGRKPTINRIFFEYRDFGKVFVEVGVLIEQDDGFAFRSEVFAIGGLNDSKLHSYNVSLVATGMRPQLIIKRLGGKGALCVINATMNGIMGDGSLL